MVLTYGGTYAKSAVGTGNPHTFTYTCPANSRVLCLNIYVRSVTARGGGDPTYNGLAMTQAGPRLQAAAEVALEQWYLINPPTGSAYTISIPNSGGLTMSAACAAGVSATADSAAIDVTNGWTGNTANPSNPVTTGTNGCWIMDGMSHGLATVETGRTQTLIHATDEGQWNDAASYANQASAGAITFGHTIAADNWCQRITAFKELAITAKSFDDVGGGSDSFVNPLRAMGFSDSGSGGDAFNTPFRAMGFSDTGGESDQFTKLVYGAQWMDYGGIIQIAVGAFIPLAQFTFEVTMKYGGGADKAYARLFNMTDGQAVPGSLLETVSTAYARVESSPLSLEGIKEYKAQIGAQQTETVTARTAKVKVTQSVS